MNVDMVHLAYIDPGTGSILLQLIIGTCFGAGVFFRQAIARMLGFGKRLIGSKRSESREEPTEE